MSSRGPRSLLLVHGRSFKPARDAWLDLSVAALRAGVERDFPDCVPAFDAIGKYDAWYGDLNHTLLTRAGKKYDAELDLADRQNALVKLREFAPRKRFSLRQYDCLPGKSAVPEFLADMLAPIVGSVGLTMPVLSRLSADFACYLRGEDDYAEQVRARVRDQLCDMLDREEQVLLVTHGTGAVVAYDVLWQLTHDSRYGEKYGVAKVDLWLTLGAPLGDNRIRKLLSGAREKTEFRFPGNVVTWQNVSAEDDYTCHDMTLADDFKTMMQNRTVRKVQDFQIYNLAVRHGRSNPHSSLGYFIHPRVSKIIADWLQSAPV